MKMRHIESERTVYIYDTQELSRTDRKNIELPSDLERLIIGDGITHMDWGFLRNIRIGHLILPHTLETISFRISSFDHGSTYIDMDPNNPYFTSEDGVLFDKERKVLIRFPEGRRMDVYTIPEGVVRIGDDAFSYCRVLEDIIFPRSLTAIGDRAFYRCTFLQNAIIPEGVDTVGHSAFAECLNIRRVNIPSSLKRIPDLMFMGCNLLSNVRISEGVRSIGSLAFDGEHVFLEELRIPSTVRELGANPFGNSDTLRIHIDEDNRWFKSDGTVVYDITGEVLVRVMPSWDKDTFEIPESVREIGPFAFEYCESLERIHIPDTVKVIGRGAFMDCDHLSKVRLPEGLTRIEDHTFHWCSSLEGIDIPTSIEYIGKHAFMCSGLRSLNLDAPIASIESGTFNDCGQLESMTLPNTLKRIDMMAFGSCRRLKRLHIPDGVTSIGMEAFTCCDSLEHVHLPEELKEMYLTAFIGCKSLRSVEFPSGMSDPFLEPFHLTSSDKKTIRDPDSSKDRPGLFSKIEKNDGKWEMRYE